MNGLALDIDETLFATNHFWIETLIENFGNPENLSVSEIVSRYRYTQNVPFWQTKEALGWMENARNSNEIQRALPLIENANHVTRQLHGIAPIAAYVTVRPEQVRQGTLECLSLHNFPEVPLIMRPKDVSHSDGNRWKAELLVSLYPNVWGIIDDNPNLIAELPDTYEGTVFLYDHDCIGETSVSVVEVRSWDDDMLEKVSAAFLLHCD